MRRYSKRIIQPFPKKSLNQMATTPADNQDLSLQTDRESLHKYYGKNQIIEGYATKEGTQTYFENSRKYNKTILKQHFRESYDGLKMSSIGYGTYIGAPDETDDLLMMNGMIESIQSGGVNVIDTSINYRHMKSERVVGAALHCLLNQSNLYKRDQLVICSKSGFIPVDQDNNQTGEQIIEQLVQQGALTDSDIAGRVHCMHPAFLQDQLTRSLNNLQLDSIDVMYLHNSAEVQMPLIGEDLYYDRLAKAFQFYEEQRVKGTIQHYGMATWTSFRAKPSEKNIYQELQKVEQIAKKVGGEGHGMKYIQLPLNMIMHEAFSSKWQQYKDICDGSKSKEKLLAVARLLELNVITSSPLWQGAMLQVPMSTDTFHCQSLGAKHLNFIRSIPSEAIKTTLVGMKKKKHIQQNLELLSKPLLSPEAFWEFLKPPQEDQQNNNPNK